MSEPSLGLTLELCARLERGHTLEQACASTGVSVDLVRTWRRLARGRGRRNLYDRVSSWARLALLAIRAILIAFVGDAE